MSWVWICAEQVLRWLMPGCVQHCCWQQVVPRHPELPTASWPGSLVLLACALHWGCQVLCPAGVVPQQVARLLHPRPAQQ